MSVTIETSGPITIRRLPIKRLYLPGVTLAQACPECGAVTRRDMSLNYLSYPDTGAPISQWVECYDQGTGEGCCHEWKIQLQLDVTLTVVDEG